VGFIPSAVKRIRIAFYSLFAAVDSGRVGMFYKRGSVRVDSRGRIRTQRGKLWKWDGPALRIQFISGRGICSGAEGVRSSVDWRIRLTQSFGRGRGCPHDQDNVSTSAPKRPVLTVKLQVQDQLPDTVEA